MQYSVVCMQVRVVALGCAADLFKSPDAQNYLASHPDFLQILVQCMQVCLTKTSVEQSHLAMLFLMLS